MDKLICPCQTCLHEAPKKKDNSPFQRSRSCPLLNIFLLPAGPAIESGSSAEYHILLVIPAEAGIHELLCLDSRLRGSDGDAEYPGLWSGNFTTRHVQINLSMPPIVTLSVRDELVQINHTKMVRIFSICRCLNICFTVLAFPFKGSACLSPGKCKKD